MRRTLAILLLIFSVSFLHFAPMALAAGSDRITPGVGGCEIVGDVPTLACLGQVVSSVIGTGFLLIGFASLAYLLYGSIKMILSQGDQKALQAAKGTVTYALVGAILVVLSFVIVTIILNALGLPSLLQNFTVYQG